MGVVVLARVRFGWGGYADGSSLKYFPPVNEDECHFCRVWSDACDEVVAGVISRNIVFFAFVAYLLVKQ